MNWHEYPILRLVVPLLLGILYYLLFPQGALPLISNAILLVIVAFLAWPRSYLFPYKHRYISGIIMYLAFFIIGISLTQYHHIFHHQTYFATALAKGEFVEASIVELPEEKQKSIKFIVEVDKIGKLKNYTRTKGRAILYLEKDSLSKSLQYGDILFYKNILKPIKGIQNPDEFNFKHYLNIRGIQYQAYLRKSDWQIVARNQGGTLKNWALQIRGFLLNELQRHNIKDAEFSVTAAMLLGVRNYLSPELQQAFSGAGAMHILCVSGLHVGIIYMLLNLLLSFMNHFKKGRLIRSVVILLSIWAYAMITGLSPSVVRAATMFSFISIGQNIGRHVNIYNSLAASAFVLLLVNPYLILDLGFQLSYAAVIAIVALQKPIQNLWTPPQIWLFKLWQLTTVSIAAQIGTAPLALYYFHSFPNYFLITNLVVIPAAFTIFISGIVVLAFSWSGILADYFAFILSKFVFLLNTFITFIEQLPYAVSRNIYISIWELIFLILISIFVPIMLIHKKTKLLFLNLTLLILFLVADLYQRKLPDQFIVYQTGKYDYLAFIHKGTEIALTDKDVIEYPELVDYQVSEHNIRAHIKKRILYNINSFESQQTPNYTKKKQFISFDGLLLAIITPENYMQKYRESIQVDYLIISGNPNLQIDTLLTYYHCKNLIIAPSNAQWNIKKWKQSLTKKSIPTYYVKEEGAFVLNVK